MVQPYRSPIKLEVSREGAAATARGGLVLLFEVLAAKRILVGLPRAVGSPAQGWSDAQMILAVLVVNVAGFDRVSDIEHLEADAGLCAMLGRFEPKLLGLSRRAIARRFRGGRERCFPSARSLRDWLDRFHVAGVHDVEREKGTAFIPAHTDRHELFREVSRRLMAEGVRDAGAGSVTIDLDATIIASGKQECLHTYRAAERVVPGERGYQPLVAFCPEIGMAPWLEARDGNVPASMDNLRALEEALLQLPDAVRRVTLRTDGAGYQDDVIRACNDPGFRSEGTRRFGTIGLICGATRSEPLMAEVTRLADDAWQPVAEPAGTGSGAAGPDKPQLECAELAYVSSGCRRSGPHHVIRYVVTRRVLPGKLGMDEGELPATDGRPAYRIRAYMTNFPAPDAVRAEKANGLKVMEAAEVVAAAHQRCGHGEEVHAVLDSYLVEVEQGPNLFRYSAVSDADRSVLDDYIASLAAVGISGYTRDEQKAYWINLYNALTVKVVLDHYPVASIREINISPGLFASGPWGAKLVTIEGIDLSLDDIEHRIFRPIWQDNRIHYAVNCASLGCPDLWPVAFGAFNTEQILEQAAVNFINSDRGVMIVGGRMTRGIAFEDFVTILVFGFRLPCRWFDIRWFEMQEFSSLFEGVEDPRCSNATRHSLHEMLLIALLSVLCGGEGCADMERFGRAKEPFLRRFMTLAHGIPSHDAFSDLFNALAPDGLQKVLLRLLEDWSALLEADVIAIDGKSLRRSFADAAARSPVHLVQAFAARARLVLGQVKVDGKSNEIAAMPKLLEMLALKGRIVTADAMHTHRATAEAVTAGGGDYVLALKGNQGRLHGDVQLYLDDPVRADKLQSCQQVDGDHGRIETRRATVCHEIAWLQEDHDWPGLAAIGKIEATRKTARQTTTETRYYIMSATLSPERFQHAVRAHWAIENCLHWVLDVTMNEDRQRNRKGYGPENLAMLRRLALNIARREPTKDAMRGKLKRAAWNDDFLLNLIRAAA